MINHKLTALTMKKILPHLEDKTLNDATNIMLGLIVTVAKNMWPNDLNEQRAYIDSICKSLVKGIEDPIRFPRMVS